MARTRYYRSRRVYPKQKWAISTNSQLFTVPGANAQGYSANSNYIVQNPSRNDASGGSVNTPAQILKAGRIKIKGVISTGMNANQSLIIAIMYIPEAITPDVNNSPIAQIGSSIFYSHPEWIMAWTRMDYTNAAQKNEFSMSSKLKRNLNPGDSIRLIAFNVNIDQAAAAPAVVINGTSSYCVRSN